MLINIEMKPSNLLHILISNLYKSVSFRFNFQPCKYSNVTCHDISSYYTGSRLRLVHFKTTDLDEIVIVFCLLTDDEQKVQCYHISRNEKLDMAMSTLIEEKISCINCANKRKEIGIIAYRLLRARLEDQLDLKNVEQKSKNQFLR